MGGKIRFTYLDGKVISGIYEVEGDMVTATASNGRTRIASLEDSMLSPEILAKVLLLHMHQDESRSHERPSWRLPLPRCARVH
jgi:hypothetical protein